MTTLGGSLSSHIYRYGTTLVESVITICDFTVGPQPSDKHTLGAACYMWATVQPVCVQLC